MPCYSPLKGYRSLSANPSGKYSIVFTLREGYKDLPIEVPCSQCIGCRLERSRQWAIRCHHEMSLYEKNCFITLTYRPDNLPQYGSLIKSHYQDFMKRLRSKIEYEATINNQPAELVRYFQCGEYGENFSRPHYHAILFNFDFQDKVLWKTVDGEKYYLSKTLEDLWGHGFTMVAKATFASAAYVARYITKKITGKNSEEHYSSVDETTGEIFPLQPEYITMSRRPGIGKGWYDKFKTDVYPWDEVILQGKRMKPPKFYASLLEAENKLVSDQIKAKRKNVAKKRTADNTPRRLSDRGTVQSLKQKTIIRKYENAK